MLIQKPTNIITTGRVSISRKNPSTASFLPSDLSGLKVWFKADQYVGSDGDAISTWSDQSGNGNHLTASGSNRPTFKTNIINGNPVIRLDGTDDYLTLTSSFYDASYSYFVVQKRPTTGQKLLSLSADVSGGFPYSPYEYDNGNTYVSSQGGIWYLSLTVAVFNYWSVVTTSGTALMWKNAVSQSLTSLGSSTSNVWDVVGRRGSGEYSNGDIAEIIMYNSALNSTDRGKVETYLAAKYAL